METLVWVVHIIVAITLIVLVLLQQGKGADMGAAFGSGSAGGLFGASGSANFLSRSTAVAATLFFITSLTLTYFGTKPASTEGVMDRVQPTTQAVPTSSEAGADASKTKQIPQ